MQAPAISRVLEVSLAKQVVVIGCRRATALPGGGEAVAWADGAIITVPFARLDSDADREVWTLDWAHLLEGLDTQAAELIGDLLEQWPPVGRSDDWWLAETQRCNGILAVIGSIDSPTLETVLRLCVERAAVAGPVPDDLPRVLVERQKAEGEPNA